MPEFVIMQKRKVTTCSTDPAHEKKGRVPKKKQDRPRVLNAAAARHQLTRAPSDYQAARRARLHEPSACPCRA